MVVRIKKSKAFKADKLKNKNYSYSQISDELGLSKSKLSRYFNSSAENIEFIDDLNHNEGVSSDTDIVSTANMDELEVLKGKFKNELNELKAEIKDYINRIVPKDRDLKALKKENKRLFGKLKFIKSILYKSNKQAYENALNELKRANKGS